MKANILLSIGLAVFGTSSAFAQTPRCDFQLDANSTLHFQVDGIKLADSSINKVYLIVALASYAKEQPVPERIQKLAEGGVVHMVAYGPTTALVRTKPEKYSSDTVLSLDLPVAKLAEALSKAEDPSTAQVVIQLVRANKWLADSNILENHIQASTLNANIANGPCMKPVGDADIVSKTRFVDGDGNLAASYITIK